MKLRGRAAAIVAGGAVISIALLGGAVALAASGSAPAAETLVSQGKPVTASSSGGCCPAGNVNDGSTTTRWASAANIDPSWIYIDLGSTFSVTHVKLTWDASCATAYQVQTSPDHSTWADIFKTTTGNGGVDDLTGLTGSGRYVRVLGTHRCRTDATKGYSLDEFQVFSGSGGGTVPQPPGQPQQVSITPTSVTLKWAASPDPADVATYQIFKDGQLCATVNAPTLQGTCDGLSPNFDYGMYINATGHGGEESQPSPTTTVHTPKIESNPPSVPTNVKMVSGSLTATSVSLIWTASTDDTAVQSYNVYNGSVAPGNKVGQSAGNVANASIQGLTPNTPYQLIVTAVDTSKNESGGSSPSVDFTTPSQGTTCTQNFCGTKQVGTSTDVVWGLVTLPDGTILYNERDAHDIVHLNPKTGAKKSIGTVPNVQSTGGEGGLTGLAINPKSFSSDHFLYIMHTSPSDNRIVRITYDPTGDTLMTSTEKVLVSGIQRNKFHDGGRLRFSPDGKFLYAGTGDAQNGANAQNTKSLNGKVLRINPDGSIPSDNPFGNAVWSYGHRNVQGLAFDSQGRLWEQEFGNSQEDETNLITKGANYGWPICEGTKPGTGSCGTAGLTPPKHVYSVGSGSCSGITIIRDVLYVACERGASLYREEISGSSLVNVTRNFNGTFASGGQPGRIRTVEPAPDGSMWLATSRDGDKDSTANNSHNTIYKVFIKGGPTA
jgi:glucose/arabinose dehydrogenase